MGEVINLRQVRKERQRQEGERQAEENRIRFGRTKAERERVGTSDERAVKRLDGHKLDLPDEPA